MYIDHVTSLNVRHPRVPRHHVRHSLKVVKETFLYWRIAKARIWVIISEVFVLSKPGATLKQVVRHGKSLFKNFTKQHFVICIAVTNDVGKHEPSQLTVQFTPEPDTIHDILYRYDASEMKNKIYLLNENIRIIVNDYRLRKSVLLYAINDILSRNHFTRQSLHLNKHGKPLLKQVLGNKQSSTRQAGQRKWRKHPSRERLNRMPCPSK